MGCPQQSGVLSPLTNAKVNVYTVGCKGSNKWNSIFRSAPVSQLSNLHGLQNGFWYLIIYCYELTCQYEKGLWMYAEWCSQKVILKWRDTVSVETHNSENLYVFWPQSFKEWKALSAGLFGNPWIIRLGIYPMSNFGLNSLSLTIYYCNSYYPYHCHYLYYDYWSTLCFSFLIAEHYNSNNYWFKICCSPSQILGP